MSDVITGRLRRHSSWSEQWPVWFGQSRFTFNFRKQITSVEISMLWRPDPVEFGYSNTTGGFQWFCTYVADAIDTICTRNNPNFVLFLCCTCHLYSKNLCEAPRVTVKQTPGTVTCQCSWYSVLAGKRAFKLASYSSDSQTNTFEFQGSKIFHSLFSTIFGETALIFYWKGPSGVIFGDFVTKYRFQNCFKVAVHTCDVLWCENLVKTQSYASLTTSCIVTLFNPIELWSIAMHYGGPLTNSNASWMLVVHRNFQGESIKSFELEYYYN